MKEEIKAGIVVLTFLIILSAFTILIGGSQIFERLDVYYVEVINAAGLEPGSQVKLGGVRVGRVLDISAPSVPGEHISVKLGLKKGTPLYKGTRALITQIGFVGDIYLLLSIKETSSEKYEVGAVIPSMEGADFNVLMSKVDALSDSLDKLVNDADKIFSQNNVEEVEKAIKNISLVLTDIDGLVKDTKGELSSLVETATRDLEIAGDMILAIKKGADTIDHTAGSIRSTAHSVEQTSDLVGSAVDVQSQNLTGLLHELTEATENLQDVLQEIKNKPWSLLYKEGKVKNE